MNRAHSTMHRMVHRQSNVRLSTLAVQAEQCASLDFDMFLRRTNNYWGKKWWFLLSAVRI